MVHRGKGKKGTSNSEQKQRSFTLITESVKPLKNSQRIRTDELSKKGGRYQGNTPMQAAKKAFTRIARSSGKDISSYSFTIRETTADNNKRSDGKPKLYSYIGTRTELKTPKIIIKNPGTSYEVRYNVKYENKVVSKRK